MSYTRPGVYVSESLTPSTPTVSVDEAVAGFVVEAPRGPSDPTLVGSWTRYADLFGGEVETTDFYADSVRQFFESNAGPAYVTRVVPTDAVAADITLQDDNGTPANTLTLTANSVGTWGNSLYVQIIDRDATAGIFDLLVYLGGTAQSNLKESMLNLSMDSTNVRYAVDIINHPTLGSKWVTASDENSATVAPDNAPTEIAATALTGGDDGSAVSSADFSTAIDKFDQVSNQAFVFAIPGRTDSTTQNALLAYAEGRGDSFAVLDTADDTVANVVTAVGSLSPASAYGAVYYPWVYTRDTRSARTKLLPPSALVVGTILRTDRVRGPQKAPAGQNARVTGAIDLSQRLTPSDVSTLYSAHVNSLEKLRDGSGSIIVNGGRSLTKTGSDRFISVRRTINYVKINAQALAEFAVHEPNGPELWSQVTNRLASFLGHFWSDGGLAGDTASEAFYVKCDAENNPPASQQAGELNIELGVAVSYPAEFIIIRIGQYEADGVATVTEEG